MEPTLGESNLTAGHNLTHQKAGLIKEGDSPALEVPNARMRERAFFSEISV